MEILIISVVFVVLALIVVSPLYILSKIEQWNNINLMNIHLGANVLFLSWSYYDLNFTQHYLHGPNSTFVIVPGVIGLFLYYLLAYRKVLKANKIPKKVLAITVLHLAFIIYGVIFHA